MLKKIVFSSLIIFAFVSNIYSMDNPGGNRRGTPGGNQECSSIRPEEYDQLGIQSNSMSAVREIYQGGQEALGHEQRLRLAFQHNGGAVEQRPCSVCLQSLIVGQEEDNNIMILPCFHIFHNSCGRRWLNVHHTCPLCRKAVAAGQERVVLIRPEYAIEDLGGELGRVEAERVRQEALENIDRIVDSIIHRHSVEIRQMMPDAQDYRLRGLPVDPRGVSKQSERRHILLDRLNMVGNELLDSQRLIDEALERALNRVDFNRQQIEQTIHQLEAQGQ